MSKKTKSEVCSWSAEIVGSNGDLLRKIFLLLPVPPLVRFKSVSKLWLSLITDPHFGHNHFLRHRDPSSVIPSGLFFSRSPANSHIFALISLKSSAKIPCQYSILQGGFGLVKMVQSCNGLQLVRVIAPDHQSKLYYVGNMTTHQIKMIPLPELSDVSKSYVFCNLAFDPLRSLHYKIVCAKRVNSDQCQFDIHSSETGEWKTTNVTANDPMHIDFENGVYWNGAIQWIKNDGVRLEFCRFEVEGEKLITKRLLSKPSNGDELYLRYFGECNGHLHVVYVRSLMSKQIIIAEIDKVTMKPFLKYRVHLDRLLSSFPEVFVEKHEMYQKSCYAFSVLCVVRGEIEEADALVMLIPGKVISYSFKSKKFEVLAYLTSQDVDIVQFRYVPAHQFVSTFYQLSA